MLLRVFIEEAKQQVACLVERQDAELVRVLNIHDLIADVVGGLHEEHQRMTGEEQRLPRSGKANDAQLIGDLLKGWGFRGEKAELAMFPRQAARTGIFYDRGKGRISHHKPSRTPAHKLVGKKAESIGIALKMRDVVPEGFRDLVFQEAAVVLREKRLDGLLSGMSEGRVAHIVRQPRCLHNGAYLLEKRIAQLRMLVRQSPCHIVTEALAQRRYLDGVSETIVHEDTSRKGKYLRLVLKAAEGSRIDQTVAVTFEFRAVVVTESVPVFLPKAFIADELLPVHNYILLRFSQSYAYFVAFRLFNRNYLNYLFEIA